MHRRLIELLELLERTRERLTEAVEQADPERIEKGPAEGKWSVAEVIDHLATVEGNVAGLIIKMIDRAGDSLAQETSEESVLDRLDQFNMGDRSIRIEAPDSTRPRPAVSLAEAGQALDRARLSLRKAIDHADGRALETLSFPHRFFGPLDLYQWILLIAHHEERHRQQILAMRGHDQSLPL